MPNTYPLPAQRLHAYQEALALYRCIREAAISDAGLRDQALRAARSACLNIGEGAGRSGHADKARVYAIARGEASEAGVALDIALAGGQCNADAARRGAEHARAAYALLTGLIRKFAPSGSGSAR